MQQKRFQDQGVIIIGATGGLGTAIAHAFADEGARLLLVGRDTERLEHLANEFAAPPTFHPMDLADPSSIEALGDFVRTAFGQVDVVVNAAGVDVRKSFDQHSPDDIRHTVDLDFVGPMLITRAFLPILRDQNRGALVHVGGFADGRLALPYFSVDVASRAGLAAFSEALNRELASTEIIVTFFSPSPADTETEREFHPLWRKMNLAIAPSQRVAKELLAAIVQHKRVHVMGGLATILFAKINVAFPALADALMLNHYRKILRQFFESTESTPHSTSKRSWSVRLGVSLVVASFVLYGGFVLVPFSDVALESKIVVSTTLVVLGEASFWIGGAILGKEFVVRYRKWLNPCNWFCRTKFS